MNKLFATAFVVAAAVFSATVANGAEAERPKAGKTEILPLKDVKPGMQATAWTVFQGTEPEAVPIEIIGVWKSATGPRQDVIIGKMGGHAKETNVAAGMSGSPVYVDGKLIGAVALRLSVFSPDAICGITPIELMLEINLLDQTRPPDQPNGTRRAQAGDTAGPTPAGQMPNDLLAKLTEAGAAIPNRADLMTPIETPLVFSGFTAETFHTFQPLFTQMGITAVQGGASSTALSAKPVAGWEKALNPGEAVSASLVSGDMSLSAMGTVTYNDGKHVLAFGHPWLSAGAVDMPLSKSDVLMTLSSAYTPTKFGNATDVVGALRQDRASGIMGELGAEAKTVPVHVKIRTLAKNGTVVKDKDLNFQVAQLKLTPTLMMLTVMNSIQQTNDFADEITYRLNGRVRVAGGGGFSLSTVLAPADAPTPPALQLASWWGEKFSRLYANPVALLKLDQVDVTVDLLPERRSLAVDNAWTPSTEVEAGTTIPVNVFLRPYRGDPIRQAVNLSIPAGLPKGDYRILFSDGDTLNRMQSIAATMGNRYIDIPETVSLISQERSNNRLYVSLIENRATYYADDKVLPSLPASVLNVLQMERTASRSLIGVAETAKEQLSVPFEEMVTGSYSLRISVK